MGDVFEVIIREFFANAFVKGDHINCWVRGREFTISRKPIQEVLEIRPTTPDTSLHYDERKEKLKPLVQVLGGQLKKKALHTIEFTPEMRALAYIMIFNLYSVKNLTTLFAPRTVFLYDLFTHKESRLSPPCQKHNEEKFKANSTIPKPHHVSNIKGKGEEATGHTKGSKPLSEVKLTFLDQASVYLKFREMKM